jgi:hypothetical protein
MTEKALAITVITKAQAEKILDEVDELLERYDKNNHDNEFIVVRVANQIIRIRDNKLFIYRRDPKTRKAFTTFTAYLRSRAHGSRSSVYRFLGVKKHLGDVPSETLEKFGQTKCYELAKVARDKPDLLGNFLKDTAVPLYTLKQQVTNVLAGHHFDSGAYERIEFAVKTEDVLFISKGLAVLQSMEAVEDPETAVGRGKHLVSVFQEFLSVPAHAKVLRKLEEAGEFAKNVDFDVDDESAE